jgi:hypothetical protein
MVDQTKIHNLKADDRRLQLPTDKLMSREKGSMLSLYLASLLRR